MKNAESCIGEPAAQWPRSNACIRRDECQAIAKVIWTLPAVVSWVFESTNAEERDRRACSLTTATTNALRNARRPWLTPQAHRNRYEKLAERLEAAPRYKPGGKRIEKLRRDLDNETALRVGYAAVTAPTHAGPTGRRPDKTHKLGKVAAAIVRITEKAGLADAPLPTVSADAGEVSPIYRPPLAELASRAKGFAKAAGDPETAEEADPNWTQPRPNAVRNIFILELTDFQRSNFGCASHALTADVVEGLVHANFLGPDECVTRTEVEVLTRQRGKKPIRKAKAKR